MHLSLSYVDETMSVIFFVALFYNAGGRDFLRKEKFRVECPKDEDGGEIKLKDLIELIL